MQKLCISLILLSAIFIGSVVSQTWLVSTSYASNDCSGLTISYSSSLSGACIPLSASYWQVATCNSTGGYTALFSDSACTTSVTSPTAIANCTSGLGQACVSTALPSGFLVSTTTYANADCTGAIQGQSAINPACTPISSGSSSYRTYCPSYQSCTDSACMTCPVTPFAPVTIPPYAPINPCVAGVLTATPTCPAAPTTPPTAGTTPGSSTPGVGSGSDKLAPALLLLSASLVVLA